MRAIFDLVFREAGSVGDAVEETLASGWGSVFSIAQADVCVGVPKVYVNEWLSATCLKVLAQSPRNWVQGTCMHLCGDCRKRSMWWG